MRIRQLDLLRYGHFTDAIIALPAGKPDFQMLLGENEAGKSTAMNGVEDLLFGIPANSSRNFLHEYNAMRVGALLEKGSDTLKVRRRKGNKDTLLGDNNTPIPSGEGALALFLAGADRRFYTRMFSLDHERLRQGGKEILQAQDDVGQILFSASAGIMGLRETLKAMEAEADALWASRRAAHRKYFQAEERLKAADASMRDDVVTTTKWQALMHASGALDRCGVTLLAGKAVGAPFVGAAAATLAISEVLRLLHGGAVHELIDLDLKAPEYRSAVLTQQDFSALNPGYVPV